MNMNIEIANRLYQYRKSMGLSQEELAEKIGVSRQAVSKWERAEASPDTDNLIELANVYGMTLDELLKGKEEQPAPEPGQDTPAEEQGPPEAGQDNAQPGAYAYDFNNSGSGININNESEKVHVGFDGIHVVDKHGTRVDVDRKHGVFVNEDGKQKVYTDEHGHIHKSEDIAAQERKGKHSFWLLIPYPILAVIAYILFGFFNVCGGWGMGWIVFLTIPIYYTLVEAILKRDANIFCYPVLAVIAFLIMGFVWGLWHPGWVVFLTIPVYYAMVNAIKASRKSRG